MIAVTKADDINDIIHILTKIECTENKMKQSEIKNRPITSLRIHLKNGIDFEIIYTELGIKSGIIQSSYQFDYHTSADLGGSFWNLSSGYEIKKVNASELPNYEQ